MDTVEYLARSQRRRPARPSRGRPEYLGASDATQAEAGAEVEADEVPDEKIAFFDIETEAWDTFVVGGLETHHGDYLEAWDGDEHFDDIIALGPGVSVYAWNGGRFDFLWFLEIARARDMKCELSCAGTRITRIQVANGPTLKDACALIPLSLEQASAIAGVPMVKSTGLPCRCGESCGGYCSIVRVGMAHADRLALSEYLRRDVSTGLAIVRAVREEGRRSGYDLRGTIGGTAYATAKRVCGFEDATWNPDTYRLARSGYFGGRVEVYRPRAPSGWGYDINSAYPAALVETRIPVGESIIISGDRAGRAFKRGKEGIYEVEVHVPDLFVPPLPCRLGDRVVFPIGRVSGAWTRIELAHALDAGCEVVRWQRAIVWESAERVCAPFMDLAWGRRQEAIAEGNGGLKQWHKLVANSFTGKCAQQPEMERVILCPDLIKLCGADGCTFATRETCERRKRSPKCCIHTCTRTCGAFRPLDRQGKLWSSTFYRLPDCGHVHWAAYLTAATRIKLRTQLIADGDGGRTSVYCDTDSVFATAPRTWNLGPELGEFGEMGEFRAWRAMAPKVYRYTAPEGFKEKIVAKAKGIPGLTPAKWETFAEGLPVTRDRGVKSLKTAARGEKLFSRQRLTRQSFADGKWFGGRKLGPDGLTYPVTIEEFEHGR